MMYRIVRSAQCICVISGTNLEHCVMTCCVTGCNLRTALSQAADSVDYLHLSGQSSEYIQIISYSSYVYLLHVSNSDEYKLLTLLRGSVTAALLVSIPQLSTYTTAYAIEELTLLNRETLAQLRSVNSNHTEREQLNVDCMQFEKPVLIHVFSFHNVPYPLAAVKPIKADL